MRSRIATLAMIFFCFMLQSTLLDLLAVGQITPNLLLVLCVCVGLVRGRKSGLWTGFIAGMLIDLIFGSLFGFYALVYMYVGYFSGYAHMIYYDDDIKVPLAMTAVADILYNLAVYVLQFLLRGRTGFPNYLVRIILPEAFYTTLICLLAYFPLRAYLYRFEAVSWKEGDSAWIIK